VNVYCNTSHQHTIEKTVCYFERVISILNICMNWGSCLTRNVGLITQIWRELLLLNVGMYQALVHIDQGNGF